MAIFWYLHFQERFLVREISWIKNAYISLENKNIKYKPIYFNIKFNSTLLKILKKNCYVICMQDKINKCTGSILLNLNIPEMSIRLGVRMLIIVLKKIKVKWRPKNVYTKIKKFLSTINMSLICVFSTIITNIYIKLQN